MLLRRFVVLVFTLALLAGLAAVAQADDPVPVPSDPTAGVLPSKINPNPCPAVNGASGQGSCDTEYTPIANAKAGSDLFKQVGGALCESNGTSPCSGTKLTKGSFTSITVDFYAVRFFDQNNGFAGGAACKDPDTTFADLVDCERVPVIWQYTNKGGEGPLWREVYRADDQGFVAAIAYYGRGKAMAVGGTGKYPYREFFNGPDRYSTTDPDTDPSGKGRVWETSPSHFGDSDWHEYQADQKPTAPNIPADPGPVNVEQASDVARNQNTSPVPAADAAKDQLPRPHPVQTPMRALTALDCSTLDEFCVAGGIQQLFMWNGGHFDRSFGNGSPDMEAGSSLTVYASANTNTQTKMRGAANFRFRVRSLRLFSGEFGAGEHPVLGVTSGCCD
ncbi:MAG: hypothetical protein QOG09_1888, partial [Solirubrobacterales bacterium]|nr:hypothetical protein [Solirubrobacterales bacterium]